MVADAAVGAAGRAWRQVAAQVPALGEVPAEVQDWAVAHLGATVGFGIITDLRTTLHRAAREARLGLDAERVILETLDLAQRQLLDAHATSCLERTLTAVCVTNAPGG